MANCGKKLRSETYTPPNQFAHDTDRTPSTCRILGTYVSGSGKTSDTELRVTSRALELAFAPAYHASTTVRRSPNAPIATTMPTTVSAVRSLCRSAFRTTSSGTNMTGRERAGESGREHAFLQVDQPMRLLGALGIVGDHDDRLAELA